MKYEIKTWSGEECIVEVNVAEKHGSVEYKNRKWPNGLRMTEHVLTPQEVELVIGAYNAGRRAKKR